MNIKSITIDQYHISNKNIISCNFYDDKLTNNIINLLKLLVNLV